MESISICRDLAIIILFAKLFGLGARKLKAPQVVGEIAAGLIIGPSILGLVAQTEFLSGMAEVGVILLMFTAGLETDIKELVKTGPAALVIACAGVLVPLCGGYLLYSCFYGFSAVGSEEFYKAVFIGVIMTATSVSITVEVLRELGRLKGRVGTAIMSAAIIDDIIGILVLTFVISFNSSGVKIGEVVRNTVLFFVFSGGVGTILHYLFKKLNKLYPHRRRMAIYGLALCLAMSYIAETFFGIADITGAYAAGIILCTLRDSEYITEKMDISSYMLFGPVFFASIGLKTDISGMTATIFLFSVCFVLTALLTKIIGCGTVSRLFGFSRSDALKIGVGMMTRGEVALIVAQKGLKCGLLEPVYFTPVILLIICSSIATPVVMKFLYKDADAAE